MLCSSDVSEEQDAQNESFFNSYDSTVQQVTVPLFSQWDGKVGEVRLLPMP